MAKWKGDSSDAADRTTWRRFYAFWASRRGVLTLTALVLGTTIALLAATISSDGDGSGVATSSTSGSPSVRNPPKGTTECSDGLDNDRDGTTDFGADSECSSRADITERTPACSDRLDNDRDGKTDFGADPECSSAADPAEKV